MTRNKISSLLKEMNITKIYLENYRDGYLLSTDEMSKVKHLFEKEFEVAGGVAIGTWGEGWGEKRSLGFNVICISDDKNKELVGKVMSQQATIFDEIIIDDFWSNWCYSDHDVELFNERFGFSLTKERLIESIRKGDAMISSLWAVYSTELLLDVSKKYVVDVSRRVNPRVKITLKLPEWREDFYHRGLFLNKLKEMFDSIYVGTESREGTGRYGSFFIANFVKALVGDKLLGVWFDQGNGFNWSIPTAVKSYLEQALLSLLSLTREVTLFHAGSLLGYYNELTAELKSKLKGVIDLRNKLKGNLSGIKVPVTQPIYSNSSDRYIEDYLGMIGIPLLPSNNFNEGDYVLITDKWIRQGDIFDLVRKKVSLILTSSATEVIAKGGYIDGLELVDDVIHVKAFIKGDKFYSMDHRRQIGFPVGPIVDYKGKEEILLYATDGNRSYPVLHKIAYDNSIVYLLSLTKYTPYLVEYYPEIVRQTMRDIVYDYLGFTLESDMPLFNVCLIPYDKRVIVLNMNDYDIEIKFRIRDNLANVKTDNQLNKVRVPKGNFIDIQLKRE
ncbi:hypothetical protein DJ531_11975 [Sulfolobus sp. A20-N-F6]|nr:hypothetical protein DJ531_11975 [Sulfolobus sp. A20-N-F6]